MSKTYTLCDANERCESSLWSLKGNQIFTEALESESADQILEIEFVSHSEAIVYVDNTRFCLKLADVDNFDVYENVGSSELTLTGSALGRFTITNIAKEDGTIMPNLLYSTTRQLSSAPTSHISDKKRSITQLATSHVAPQKINTTATLEPYENEIKRRRVEKVETKKVEKKIEKPCPILAPAHFTSLQLKFCPNSLDITVDDINTFFSGLKLRQLYICMTKIPQSSKSKSQVCIYVEFDVIHGVDLAILRNNENLWYKQKTTSGIKRVTQKIQLVPANRLESLWVEATGLPMMTSSHTTMTIREILQSIPQSLSGFLSITNDDDDMVEALVTSALLFCPLEECNYWLDSYLQFATQRQPLVLQTSKQYQESCQSFAVQLLQTFRHCPANREGTNDLEKLWKSFLGPLLHNQTATIITTNSSYVFTKCFLQSAHFVNLTINNAMKSEEEERNIESVCLQLAMVLQSLEDMRIQFILQEEMLQGKQQEKSLQSMMNKSYWLQYLQQRKTLYELIFYRFWKVSLLENLCD